MSDEPNKVLDLLYKKTKQVQEWEMKKQDFLMKVLLKYSEPGSNRHRFPYRCLRPTRLPIPPSEQIIRRRTAIAKSFLQVLT